MFRLLLITALSLFVALGAALDSHPAEAGKFRSFKGHGKVFHGKSFFHGKRGFHGKKFFHGRRHFRGKKFFHGKRFFHGNRFFHGKRHFRSKRRFHGKGFFFKKRHFGGFHRSFLGGTIYTAPAYGGSRKALASVGGQLYPTKPLAAAGEGYVMDKDSLPTAASPAGVNDRTGVRSDGEDSQAPRSQRFAAVPTPVPEGCERVSKMGRDENGTRVRIGGTLCFDQAGQGFIVAGSRYVMAR